MTDRPNILFITSDQHRFDAVGFMGHPDVQTPNLDRLAASGVVFDRCYVTNPVCMPSRATLMTGQFPDAHGVRRNGIEVPDPPGLIRYLDPVAAYTVGIRELASHERRPARHADRIGHVAAIEDDAACRQAVQIGRLNVRMAHEAHRVKAVLIRSNEKDIGSIGHSSSQRLGAPLLSEPKVCALESPVYLSAVTNADHRHDLVRVVDGIKHPVVTDADSVDRLSSGQPLRAFRAGIRSQLVDREIDSLLNGPG